ncbi:carbohydrate ABC transporter permease [Paenibacillus thalictri]|uniref:Carbohydrate ABC transporter permease n=1 Tax=Paenibacillus thalictri TaxID=2527873 RepID=A0A4Q9DHK8_9BACL|nr:carbohydrate ABC transporter permease [Paenibacillus thalictri]TBL72428.1 carbohydrate ABC transporter permease [Paenibacillus thalictri]
MKRFLNSQAEPGTKRGASGQTANAQHKQSSRTSKGGAASFTAMLRGTGRYGPGMLLVELVMLVLAAVAIVPFYFVLLNTLKTRTELTGSPLTLPKQITLANYAEAFRKMDLSVSFTNSLLITVVSVTLIVLFGAMAAYPVSRIKNGWTKGLLSYFLIGFMVPLQTTMVPLFIIIKKLGLVNQIGGLMLIYSAQCVFSFFMYQGFMKTVPRELEEAATIDGCSLWQGFWKIVFPLLKPVTVTVIIFESMWIWNDFMFAYLFLHSKKSMTLVLEIFQGVGEFTNDWPTMLSTMVIILLPSVVFYLFMQRHIISGLTSGALKG